MADYRWDEELISQVENSSEGQKHGRDARKYAVDAWKIHTGEWEKPLGGRWKDPYAKLDKAAKPKTAKARPKKK